MSKETDEQFVEQWISKIESGEDATQDEIDEMHNRISAAAWDHTARVATHVEKLRNE